MNRSRWFPLALPRVAIFLLSLALTVFMGFLDYITGRDFALSAFYLIPICFGTWLAGRNTGITLACASVVAWFIADFLSGHVYRHALTPYWNGLMLLVLFLVVVLLLSAFQTAHDNLEETVQRRTEALQKEIAERKRLEAANLQAERLATVGTMAAQVAHEIRNPLGSITLNLDLIRKEIDKLTGDSPQAAEEGRALVEDMRAEIQRIQRVIKDYLQFARLPKLQRRTLPLNAFLSEKLEFLNPELAQGNVKLSTHFDPTLAQINADPEKLWQAVLNLIRNSCEAMPQGGELTLGTWRDGNQMLLRIGDSGKGLTPEQVQRVFTPFYTTKREGTGLGLALVQQIVTEHGGHVECESISGKGTTFTIFLSLSE